MRRCIRRPSKPGHARLAPPESPTTPNPTTRILTHPSGVWLTFCSRPQRGVNDEVGGHFANFFGSLDFPFGFFWMNRGEAQGGHRRAGGGSQGGGSRDGIVNTRFDCGLYFLQFYLCWYAGGQTPEGGTLVPEVALLQTLLNCKRQRHVTLPKPQDRRESALSAVAGSRNATARPSIRSRDRGAENPREIAG